MSDIARRVDQLSPEKRKLLLARLQQKQREAAPPAILPREDQHSYPLSFAQQRMWILNQMEPESPFYNIGIALRLIGPLDASLLEQSLSEVIRRHEVLRSFYRTEQGSPLQGIRPLLTVELPCIDVGHLKDAVAREAFSGELPAELLAYGIQEARQVFDLSQGPLLRGRLLRLDERDHVALMTLHHIVADGWSMGVLIREIALIYEALVAGRPSPLADLTIQYADFAAWQRSWLNRQATDGGESPLHLQLAYWKDQLRGVPARLELPTDRPRPAVRSSNGATYRFSLGSLLAQQLRSLARDEDTTLYVALLAAYQVLLHRYSGQDDICVGTPIANRNHPEIEDLIGFFVNTVVMRSNLATNPSYRELLRQVRERNLEAQANQDVPFEIIVEELQPHRDLSTTPLFQVMFDLDTRPSKGFKLPGLSLNPLETHSRTAKFDLTLFMTEVQGELSASFEYSTDLWDEPSIAGMAESFRHVLAGIVTSPDTPVGQLPILAQEEQHRIVAEWNDTVTEYPRDLPLQVLFEAQAERTPDRIAVRYGDQALTYRELNQRANQLAHHLRELGVQPDQLVAVFMERSLDMMVGFLAIIKAGGAYLPLDSDYPQERLDFMLEDGRVRVVLSQSTMVGALPPRHQAHVICLDEDWPQIAPHGTHNPSVATSADHLAYVIYTSGSTGRPKGVSIPQRTIARLVLNTNYVQLSAEDRIAQVSNASFDAATFEIWGAWLHGGQLIGIPKEVVLSARRFGEQLKRDRITVLFVTTALFNHIVRQVPDAFASLQTLKFGGEAADPRWVRQVLQKGKPQRLLNVYGPTESTTYATWHPIEHVKAGARSIPIGKPLSNTQVYVLDRRLSPVPIGVVGQLCLGGDGLARDYLNRPALTADRFVPNPFARRRGERIYLTGDLVRQMPDGSIDFVGRIDHQVKIRGFRIELGEVETVLGQHPAVSEVLVVAMEPDEERAERRLVAYVVPQQDQAPNASELGQFLKERLPYFMVPSAFVFLQAFPLNPNGKVDQEALPSPEAERPNLVDEFVAPRTPLEQYLAEKWQEVLGIERVGVYDNFFELGGNSLQAAVLINRFQEALGETAHVRALFMAPTVADLALYMSEYYPDSVERLGLQPRGVQGYAFVQDLQTGDLVDEAMVARFRSLIPPLAARPAAQGEIAKNPPAVFLLSPPRTGSTLLRVMLQGNPRLFSPPELDLLSFQTLGERKAAFTGKYSFWLEGPVRALMEIKGCTAGEAQVLMSQFEAQDLTTKQFYSQLQAWIGERLLVDKTPVYALDPNILQRAEAEFEQARFIHLTRHPYATVYSFLEARLDELFFRHEHPFGLRQLAELVWLVSHQNILKFLEEIPAGRQHRIAFEDLVRRPADVLEGLCHFLGVGFHPDMLRPYEGDKMISGLSPDHQMVGDFKFYLRKEIDAKAADRWKRFIAKDFLSEMSWQVAESLGYQRFDGGQQTAGTTRPAAPAPGRIATAPRDRVLPLSFAQQRLWFLDQWETGGTSYNVPAAARLKGDLNVSVLKRSLREIVRRHEVLRTTFESVDGKPIPVVSDSVHLPFDVVDLRHLQPTARDREMQRLAKEAAQHPFSLSTGPLLRVRLLRIADDEYVVLVTMHHIVSDGWSVRVFNRELMLLYEAFIKGDESPLEPLAVQYGDYAYWQRQWLASDLQQEHIAYWERQLAGLPPLIQLPTDRPRPATQTQRGARLSFELPRDLKEQLHALGRQEDATLFMTLLAAFQALLYRYTGQLDFAVGTPVAARNHSEIEPLIGFFVNTLVLRCRLASNDQIPSFRNLLRQARDVALGAFDHQDIPFEMLVDVLQPQRAMSHTPLFQVMFAFQDAPMRSLQLPGVTLTPLESDSGSAKFDLSLTIIERQDSLRGALEFNTDLFESTTAQRLIDHYCRLLEDALRHPDRSVADLEFLSDDEREQMLVRWNQTDAPFPDDTTIHSLVEEQAARSPHALALEAPTASSPDDIGASLTYRELNRRANQLAHHLRSLGVGPDTLVGLALPRSAEMIIGILGILKAGGAYLPIDPAYPQDRVAFMIQDSGIRVLLTSESADQRISESADQRMGESANRRIDESADPGAGPQPFDHSPIRSFAHSPIRPFAHSPIHTLLLDSDWPTIARQPETNPESTANPDNLAYVIYTSGSTGKPKGVMISHRSALNLAAALQHTMYEPVVERRSRDDRKDPILRISLNAPLSFDASVQQIVMLTRGYTLVVIPEALRSDAHGLLDFISRRRLDQLDCVPSQLKLLLDAGLLADPAAWTPSLVFPGGEAIDPDTWHRLATAASTDFFNVYGPTECAVDVTTINVRAYPSRPSIGRPLRNTRVYVLDRHLNPVPVGVPGQLFIGGPGLARGYLKRPGLTAERFIPNPFVIRSHNPLRRSHNPLRLYATGDLVRWLPDGHLDFLGRLDHQVKVRGFRIELGEIETTLRHHRSLADAVVVVRTDSGDQRIVAYVVPQDRTNPPSTGDLRRFLQGFLPDHMLPAIFVVLEALPLTPNRKVDRGALPPPDQARPDLDSAFVAPTSQHELLLAQIWADVLGLESVGIHDNFFELGGDSILSIQVIARANQAGLSLAPKHLFQAPTVAQLAAHVGSAPSILAEQGPVTGPLPLAPIQRRFFELDLVEPNHWNQAILLQSQRPLDPESLRDALATVLTHHDALRLRFSPSAAGWQAFNAPPEDPVPFQAFSLADLPQPDQARALRNQVDRLQASLDIANGPLIAMAYFDLGPDRPSRLFIAVHHLAIDGVSWRILLDDLLAAYTSLANGRSPALPPKSSSFRQWATRLADFSRRDDLSQQLPFWLALAEQPAAPLPLDFPAGSNTEGDTDVVDVALSHDDTVVLLQRLPTTLGADISDALLAALVQALAPWTESRRLLVALEGHGREPVFDDLDLSRTVGWFTSLFPLSIDLTGVDSPVDVLRSVHRQRQAVPWRGLSFGLLRYLNPDSLTALSALPEPQISLNYLGQFDRSLTPSLAIRPAPEAVGSERAPSNPRQFLIDVSASIVEGQLRIAWLFSQALHHRSTINDLAQAHLQALQNLIDLTRMSLTADLGPGQLLEGDLSQEELDALIAEIA